MNPTITSFDVLPAERVATRPSRARWPIFGVVAGVSGFLAGLFSVSNGIDEEDAALGIGVIDGLDRVPYHVSFLLGLVSVAALLVTASAWRRWAEGRAPRDLAARTIAGAISATATINILGTALAGSMALYLPGGMDEGWLSKEAMFVNHSLLDFGQLLGWWGVMVAAGCVAALALRPQRLLPRWMGAVSIVLMLPAIAFAVLGALPGFPGIVMPVWLVVTSVGMMFSRTAAA